MKKKIKKSTSCTGPIGLANKNEMKYRLTFDGSQIYLNTPKDDGYEPYPVRFYILAQIIHDYELDYIYVDSEGKETRLPAVVNKQEMLKRMEGHTGCVYSMNDGRVYAFVAPGEIISDVEPVIIDGLEEGDYVLHPLNGLFNQIE